ncbi:hypothetical protein D3C81_1642740 [compost metagenome]
MQQYRGGLKSAVVSTSENLFPVKTQHAVLRPLVAVNQNALAVAEQQYPTRRLLVKRAGLAKHHFIEDAVPVGIAQFVVVRTRAEKLVTVQLQRQRIFALAISIQCTQHP